MAINESWVLIQGDHRKQFPDLFLNFHGYWPTGRVFRAGSREEANSFVAYEDRNQDGSMEIVQKAVFMLGPWTAIDDPELILMDDIDGLTAISAFLSSRVLAIQSLDRSKKYGFRHVHKSQMRSLISWNGKIQVSEGAALPEEARTDPERFNEEDVIGLLGKFHLDPHQINGVKEFQVYEIEESEVGELVSDAKAEAPAGQRFGSSAQNRLEEEDFKSPEVKAPWWKFW